MTLAQNRFPYPEDLNGIIELINYITKEDIPQLTDEDVDQDGYAEVQWSANMKEFVALWYVPFITPAMSLPLSTITNSNPV